MKHPQPWIDAALLWPLVLAGIAAIVFVLLRAGAV